MAASASLSNYVKQGYRTIFLADFSQTSAYSLDLFGVASCGAFFFSHSADSLFNTFLIELL